MQAFSETRAALKQVHLRVWRLPGRRSGMVMGVDKSPRVPEMLGGPQSLSYFASNQRSIELKRRLHMRKVAIPRFNTVDES